MTGRVFELAMETSAVGIMVARGDGTILLANRDIERQFGYGRDTLVGEPIEVILPDALSVFPPQASMQRAEIRGGTRHQLQGRRQNGSRCHIEIELTPMQMGDEWFVLASVLAETEHGQLDDAQRPAFDGPTTVERLVSELSASFIDIVQDEFAASLERALCRTCRALGFDRSVLHRQDPDGALIDEVRWTGDGVAQSPRPELTVARFPWTVARIRSGETVSFSTLDEVPHDTDRQSYRELDAKSAVILPLIVSARIEGALAFHAVRAERLLRDDVLEQCALVAGVFGGAVARAQTSRALHTALTEATRLKAELQAVNVQLRHKITARPGGDRLVGESAALRRVLDRVAQVAETDSTVLLLGEKGTGKRLLAAEIHHLSSRRERAMVRVNCAAIPPTLIESELFGREKGAFTGALARQVGRFESAHGSTIFLDEIGDLPLDLQVKLLRVLEERQIERLGSPNPVAVDARVVAATHRNLEQRAADRLFREDLYFRLNVFPIHVPPLRERLEDIPLLVWRFVAEFSKAFGRRVDSIAEESLMALQHYTWPGNLRELRNVVERAMITTTDPRLTIVVPGPSAVMIQRSPKLVDVEREHIRSILDTSGWRIRGSNGAANRLGLKPTTLETRMAKLGLRRKR